MVLRGKPFYLCQGEEPPFYLYTQAYLLNETFP